MIAMRLPWLLVSLLVWRSSAAEEQAPPVEISLTRLGHGMMVMEVGGVHQIGKSWLFQQEEWRLEVLAVYLGPAAQTCSPRAWLGAVMPGRSFQTALITGEIVMVSLLVGCVPFSGQWRFFTATPATKN